MHRSMSYRKPVPIYVPSPPSSPPLSKMRLSLVLGSASGTDDYMPPLPDDWRDIIEQALTDESDTLFRSDEILIGRPVRQALLQASPTPSMNHFTMGGEMGSECQTALPSAAVSPVNPECNRPHKRKLPQHYRPPTPPLPTHYNKQRIQDDEAQVYNTHRPCMTSEHAQEHRSPTPRRRSTTQAASFSTIWTKSPSLKTDNTYSSFGNSEPSVLFSGSFSTYGGLGAELPILPRHCGRSEITVKTDSKRRFISSWRDHLESWGTSLKVKLQSFTRMCIR